MTNYLSDKRVLAGAGALALLLVGAFALILLNRGDRGAVASTPIADPTPSDTGAIEPSATSTPEDTTTTKGETPTPEPAATKSGGKIGDPAQQEDSDLQADRPKRKPIVVMVENHPDARPQSGMDRADIVYEAPAEFGIPRFMLVFSTKDAKVLGPVRSARHYFVTWASEYDGVYVHAGGSPKAESWIKQLEVDDVNALRYPSTAFWRTSDRIAPHNLYMNTAKLRQDIAKDKRLREGKGSWGGIKFSDRPTVGADEGTEVKIVYNDAYSVTYYYDARSGLYKREMLDEPHVDRESKKQYTAAAVVVQSISMWQIEGDVKGRMDAAVQSKKPVLVFQNGRVIKGFWYKDKRDTPTEYTTEDGKPILFKRGQIWIQMAPIKDSKIQY